MTKTYTVKSGDTLYAIAQAVYGNGNKYLDIFEANKSILPSADAIEVGMVLTLPGTTGTGSTSPKTVKSNSTLPEYMQPLNISFMDKIKNKPVMYASIGIAVLMGLFFFMKKK